MRRRLEVPLRCGDRGPRLRVATSSRCPGKLREFAELPLTCCSSVVFGAIECFVGFCQSNEGSNRFIHPQRHECSHMHLLFGSRTPWLLQMQHHACSSACLRFREVGGIPCQQPTGPADLAGVQTIDIIHSMIVMPCHVLAFCASARQIFTLVAMGLIVLQLSPAVAETTALIRWFLVLRMRLSHLGVCLQLAADLGGGRPGLLRNCGHLSHEETPAALLHFLSTFVSRCLADAHRTAAAVAIPSGGTAIKGALPLQGNLQSPLQGRHNSELQWSGG